MKIINLTGFLKSEFEPSQDFEEVFERHGLRMGRMLAGSKSGYRERHPDNNVVFNGNIIIENHGKIWYGDLDVTLDQDKLQTIANELCRDLYILREHDARWGKENQPIKELKQKAVEIIKCK